MTSSQDSPTDGKSAFLSHSTADDGYVMEFQSVLRGNGYTRIFNDGYSIGHGDEFWPAIKQGIRQHEDFFVFLSHDSVKSKWVLEELKFARGIGKKIRGIRIDDCKVPAELSGLDVANLRAKSHKPIIGPSKLLHHAAEHFLGREPQLALLDEAWANETNVLSIIAWGGVGKTALITEWVQTRFIEKQWQADDGKPALDAYFDWTFYDQGTRSLSDGTEARTGSVGDFFEQALAFLGDPDPNLPGKGRRLAELIRQQRSLIILDGLEPLQQPPSHPQAGRLLDPDLRDLLAALAQSNPGLCLITSRQALTDLHSLRRTVHQERELEDLPVGIAVQLLRDHFHINGSDQKLAEASEKFGCHALSLTLLGCYLREAHGGDIRRLDRIDLQRADDLTRDFRHRSVWRILETYESWLATAQADGNPKILAVLRLTGLFDRAATADCLAALRAEPIIPGLTDAICGVADDEWNILLKRLERAHLIKLRESPNVNPQSFAQGWAIDVHPLICGYFAHQVKRYRLEAWHLAHRRLYMHICENTKEGNLPTLEDLQPLYQAIRHGCLGGIPEQACNDVYRHRITRGKEKYVITKLGDLRSDLDAIATFFEGDGQDNWAKLQSGLTPQNQAMLLNQAGFRLRAFGQLGEAWSAISRATELAIIQSNSTGDWTDPAQGASNLSELSLLTGDIREALRYGELAIQYGERCRDASKIGKRTTYADALHSAGRRAEAHQLFREAITIQIISFPDYPLLHTIQGFRQSDLEMADIERVCWRTYSKALVGGFQAAGMYSIDSTRALKSATEKLENVIYRTETTQAWTTPFHSVFSRAMDSLTIGRAKLLFSIVTSSLDDSVTLHLTEGINGLRKASRFDYIPRCILTAAFYHGTLGENMEEAERLLEEAQQIAERGPMPLYLADVHLHRARLFGRLPKDERESRFPDIDPKAELAEARCLIEKHGYWRRKEELEDAEAASVNW